MRFSIPLPPSINRTYRGAFHGGRLLLTAEARAWKTKVGYALNQQDFAPISGDCEVRMRVYMKWLHKGDHHNATKITLDILQGRAYYNDAQVVDLHVIRCYDKDNPHVEIEVIGR